MEVRHRPPAAGHVRRFGILMPAVPAQPHAAPVLEFKAKQRSGEGHPEAADAQRARSEETEQKRRAEAERHLQEARAVLEATAEALAERTRAAEAARANQQGRSMTRPNSRANNWLTFESNSPPPSRQRAQRRDTETRRRERTKQPVDRSSAPTSSRR